MSLLTNKTPTSEYLNGKVFVKDKLTGTTSDPIPFKYKNPNQKEVDQVIENQPIKGLQMDKLSNLIYTSYQSTFKGSYDVQLEDEERTRKVKKVLYDRTNSKRTDMRLVGIKNKELYLGKLLTLE
jgi:hypothetical protein